MDSDQFTPVSRFLEKSGTFWNRLLGLFKPALFDHNQLKQKIKINGFNPTLHPAQKEVTLQRL